MKKMMFVALGAALALHIGPAKAVESPYRLVPASPTQSGIAAGAMVFMCSSPEREGKAVFHIAPPDVAVPNGCHAASEADLASAEMAVVSDGGQVLRITRFAVAEGFSVELATVRRPDGQVCQDYIKSASRSGEGHISAPMETICGPTSNGEASWPAQLGALQTVQQDGLSWQRPIGHDASGGF
jgi:hypothetical protein